MKSVFILQHSYERDGYEETKFIGVYSSRQEAEAAVKRLTPQNGFKYHPNDFYIAEYELNQDHWVDGFATMTSIQVKDKEGEWMTVGAEMLPDDKYIIVENYRNDELGPFKNGDVVRGEERDGDFYAVEKVE